MINDELGSLTAKALSPSNLVKYDVEPLQYADDIPIANQQEILRGKLPGYDQAVIYANQEQIPQLLNPLESPKMGGLNAGGVLRKELTPTPLAKMDEVGYNGRGSAEGTWSKGWYKSDGSINYPPNNGAVLGSEETITLQPGGKLGRYGKVRSNSNYVTDVGADSNKLALPPNTNPAQYYEYEIVKPISNTVKSIVAEWPIGSKMGGAPQYELPMSIEDLRLQGFIKLIIK